jgi:hypothetical protein
MSKINIKKFCLDKSLTVCPIVYTNKNYICIEGWKSNDLLKSHTLTIENCGGYMIKLNSLYKNYVILDTDNEETYNYVIELIKKYNLKEVKTASYSGLTNKLYYKCHFWFKLPELDFEIKDNKGKFMEKLDIIITHIAEQKDTEIVNDLDELPIEFINEVYNIKKVDQVKQENKDNVEHSEQKIIDLLNLLKPTRGDTHDEWLSIGSALKSIDEDFDIIFDNFSKTRKEYSGTKDIKKRWQGFPDNNNIGTLINMAKQDNPEELKIWYKKYNEKYDENEEYNKLKEEFEKTHFKVNNPLLYCTINSNNELIRNARGEFIDKYENLLFKKGDKEFNFVKQWMKDPKIRTYDNVDFLPCQQAPDNVYNTFNGFAIDKNENKTITGKLMESNLMKHIKNICNNDDKVFEYFINYLACRVKCPYKLTNTALIIRGKQGSGKDFFFNWFGEKILGNKYFYSDDKIDNIFGHFNHMIENKILIILNEANGKDSSEYIENIKNSITRKINIINPKGEKQFNNTNNIGFVFLTNNTNPIKIAPDDRRFCAIEMNSSFSNNSKYFSDLKNEFDNEIYDYEFYQFLLNRNIDNYDFTNKRPITNFYKNMKELNTPIIVKFLEDIYFTHNKKTIIEFKANEIFDFFNGFVKMNNFKNDYSSTKFGLELKTFTFIEKKRKSNGFYYCIKVNEINNYLIENGFVDNVDFIEN